jgi:hypothetical protein
MFKGLPDGERRWPLSGDEMDQASPLTSTLVELFTAIRLLAGYPMPDALPEVHLVSQSWIQQEVCLRPCRVPAFYDPARGVFIDEKMDLQDDPWSRSILLHELVHHVQARSGRFETVPSECERRHAEELEAYEIQNRYLGHVGHPRRAITSGWSVSCPGRQ